MTANSAAPPTTAPSSWFHSARFDLAFLLLVPFATWPLLTAAMQLSGAALLNQLIVLSATGHYFATFARAYGDRELLTRFAVRLRLAPLLLIPACLWFVLTGREAVLLLATAAWGFWHWLAQAFGFARIYDHKCGAHAPLTAWLDKALVTAGFVSAVVLNDGSVATFAKLFLAAGLPVGTHEGLASVRTVVAACASLIGVAYLLHLGDTIRRGRPWSRQKQLMHATTIGYYWFAFAWLQNVPIAYVLYELFHDVQYYAITWLYGRRRVARPGTTSWFRMLFRPGPVAAGAFVGLMFAAGGIDCLGRSSADGGLARQLTIGLSAAAALLHYYYDGFLWKAREPVLARDLGLAGGHRDTVVPALRHAARWSLFVAPVLTLLWLSGPPLAADQRSAALVALAPDDFLSRADLAFALAQRGDLATAVTHYRAAVAAHPGYGQVRANFGATLEFTGDLAGAREQYEAALALPDTESAHRMAHVNLGVLQLLAGEAAAAQQHFTAGERLGGQPPMHRLLGLADALPAAEAERKQRLLEAAVRLDGRQLDARLRLGQLALQQRRFPAAREQFQAAIDVRSDLAPALLGRAAAQLELGQTTAARADVERVLQLEPANEQALALRVRLGGN